MIEVPNLLESSIELAHLALRKLSKLGGHMRHFVRMILQRKAPVRCRRRRLERCFRR
jgi:hypothetical protein